MITLLEATTEEATSKQFTIAGRQRPVTFLAPGLASAETATLQFWSGTDWVDTALKLTATNPILKHDGPLVARIKKSATVAAVPIRAVTDVHHAGFSIQGMFAGGIKGLYLDLSVGSTVFRDTYGTLRAGPGDKIALIKDLSGNGNHGVQHNAGSRTIYTGDAAKFDEVAGSIDFVQPAVVTDSNYTFIMDYELGVGDTIGTLVTASGLSRLISYNQASASAATSSPDFTGVTLYVDGVLETPATQADVYDIAAAGGGRHRYVVQFNPPNTSLSLGAFPEGGGSSLSLGGKMRSFVLIKKSITAGEIGEISKL